MIMFKNLKVCFKYIDSECRRFDLSLDTPDDKIEEYYVALTGLDDDNEKTIREKRNYLYNYVLDEMIKDNEITLEQKRLYIEDLFEKESKLLESTEMSSLGIYHKMNKKYKGMFEDFIIYRDIEYCAFEKGTKLKNYEILELKDIILKFYEEDSITNYPLNHTTKFIANHYLDGDISIKELKANSWSNIYNAIEDDNIELLRIDSLRNDKKNKYKDMER